MSEIIKSYQELPTTNGRQYVIGDIHGCAEELQILLNYFVKHEKLSKEDLVVFVGDYIDRGSDSSAVVQQLIDFSKENNCLFLKGNHEDMLLDYLELNGQMGEAWLINGGQATLRSYGLSVVADLDEVLSKMPSEHLDFYQNLHRYLITDSYVIVHAGLDPLRELTAQVDSDLFWIREEFIDSPHTFDKTVIFGHTPQSKVLFDLPYKIGIDTGLVFGNKLSALELNEKNVLSIGKSKSKVTQRSVKENFKL